MQCQITKVQLAISQWQSAVATGCHVLRPCYVCWHSLSSYGLPKSPQGAPHMWALGSGCRPHCCLPRDISHRPALCWGWSLTRGWDKTSNPFLPITPIGNTNSSLLLCIHPCAYKSADTYPLSYVNITNADFKCYNELLLNTLDEIQMHACKSPAVAHVYLGQKRVPGMSHSVYGGLKYIFSIDLFFFLLYSLSATYRKCLFCVMASILSFSVMHLTCPCKFLIFGTSHFTLADSKKALALTTKNLCWKSATRPKSLFKDANVCE